MVGQPTDKKGRNYKGKHFDHLFYNTFVVILLLLNNSIKKNSLPSFCYYYSRGCKIMLIIIITTIIIITIMKVSTFCLFCLPLVSLSGCSPGVTWSQSFLERVNIFLIEVVQDNIYKTYILLVTARPLINTV